DLVDWRITAEGALERRCFWSHAYHVKHGHRAVARKRGAEVLELVGARRATHASEHGHGKVVLMPLADDLADRAPVGQVIQLRLEAHDERALAMLVEVKAIFRRSAGQRSSERRRPGLEIAARAEH